MKLDNIELFREEINRKDLELIHKIRQKDISLIEKRFKKWEKRGSWNDFVGIAKTDACSDIRKVKADFTPINIMCKFIENCGDPLVYLKAISVSYPDHPFSLMLIECRTMTEFLNNIKSLEPMVEMLFQDKGKKWLYELFEVSKGFVRKEYESEMQSTEAVDACA